MRRMFAYLLTALSLCIAHQTPRAIAYNEFEIRELSDQDGLYVEEWRGKQRTCTTDLVGLRTALVRHAVNRALFNANLSGDASFDPTGPLLHDLDVERVEQSSPPELLAQLHSSLESIDSISRTEVIITDFEISRGSYSLCVWVLVPDQDAPISQKSQLSERIGCDRPVSVLVRESMSASAAVTVEVAGAQIQLPSTNCDHYNPAELFSAISDSLIPEALETKLLDGSINRIVVLPVVDFSQVPLSALPLGEGSVVADQASVVVLPDLSSLFARGFVRGDGKALVVGNPTADLDGAVSEANYAHSKLGGDLLLGQDEASLSRVIDRLSRLEHGSIVYFASHGVSNPGKPLRQSLLNLGGGDLRGDTIASMKLPRIVVVLSACQTGLGKVYGGGVLGLARAWHYAGSGQVVMSLWDLGDQSTSVLMRAFVDNLANGLNVEDALRSATSAGRKNLGNPQEWSGLTVFGIPSRR